MNQKIPLMFVPLLLVLGLGSCAPTTPTAGDMDRYYKVADAQAQRQIVNYTNLRDEGSLSDFDYEQKVDKARADVGKHAMEMAWAHHEMAEAVKRDLGIPTGDHPVANDAPNYNGNSDSFYHQAGTVGPGYQGTGSGMWHGYTPGSTVGNLSSLMTPGGP